jgi:hypothetical protein
MKIKLTPANIQQTVDRILSGDLPPETNNREVIQALAQRSIADGIEIIFWRSDGNTNYSEYVEYTLTESQTLASKTSH